MIEKPPTFRVLPNLAMPLRDALRGVATLADATEEMLEPAARLLPEPLRARFQQALETLEAAGKRLIHAPIDMRHIEVAAGFLAGAETENHAVETSASVLAYAWGHLNDASPDHKHLISEAILADQLLTLRNASALSGFDFAATVLISLRHSSAIGPIPGLPRTITAKERQEHDLALLAIAVWLLSNRSDTLEEEEKLLDLALALTRALQDESSESFSDRHKLAGFLAEASAHL